MPTVEQNGFEGELFIGNGSKNIVMIVMSGANGGMKLTKGEALFYHNNGIPALALALFKTKQTCEFLDRVPVEKIKAPILLLSSKRDEVWPSYESSLYIENRLREKGFTYPVKHIAYEDMSHAMITHIPIGIKLVFKMERNNPKACNYEREKMSKELIAWVRNQ